MVLGWPESRARGMALFPLLAPGASGAERLGRGVVCFRWECFGQTPPQRSLGLGGGMLTEGKQCNGGVSGAVQAFVLTRRLLDSIWV